MASDDRQGECVLRAAGWNGQVRKRLEELINQGAGKRLPVVFDFDNTIICGDVGEATLAVLARSGPLNRERVPKGLCPAFRVSGKQRVDLDSCADITEYYAALLAPTAHAERDPTPLANGYAWAVEIMQGLSPWEIVTATRSAYAVAEQGKFKMIEVTPGKTGFPAPFFYSEMVELLAELVRHGFEVWIISASNVWSVRWMVLHALNPLLHERGVAEGVAPDHVIGISTLLVDEQDCLYKDAVLVRERRDYAALEPKALASFRLSNRLEFPVPTYSGKIARMFDVLGQPAYLGAGDSPGDHAMLSHCEHRLWMARLEKTAYQEVTAQFVRQTGEQHWMIQAIDSGKFLP